jgi:putative transposase
MDQPAKICSGKVSMAGRLWPFSYGKSQRDGVIKYILNQEQHHRLKSFREEYLEMLNKFEIIYEPKYLFEFYN